MVVTHLKNEMNRGDFFMTLRNQPVALSLYKQVSVAARLFCSLPQSDICSRPVSTVGICGQSNEALTLRQESWWTPEGQRLFFAHLSLLLACQFCKLQEQETLKDLYNQDDDHQELANYYVSASYREKVRVPFSCPVFASSRRSSRR